MTPEYGHVYYLKSFTAPKVFNGLYFECLLTDQKIASHNPIKKDLGLLKDWTTEIYKPERFNFKSN